MISNLDAPIPPPRKPRVDKGETPPLRRLKACSLEDRRWAYDLSFHQDEKQRVTSAEARRLIKERLGIALGTDGVYSNFLSWQFQQAPWDAFNEMIEQGEQQEAAQNPELSREKIRERAIQKAYALSSRMSELTGDPASLLKTVKTDLSDSELSLERERFELMAAEKMLDTALRQKADELNASGLSQADKIAAMRQAAFADVDALQKSGAVKIPKA